MSSSTVRCVAGVVVGVVMLAVSSCSSTPDAAAPSVKDPMLSTATSSLAPSDSAPAASGPQQNSASSTAVAEACDALTAAGKRRFEEQVRFVLENPELTVEGSATEDLDEGTRAVLLKSFNTEIEVYEAQEAVARAVERDPSASPELVAEAGAAADALKADKTAFVGVREKLESVESMGEFNDMLNGISRTFYGWQDYDMALLAFLQSVAACQDVVPDEEGNVFDDSYQGRVDLYAAAVRHDVAKMAVASERSAASWKEALKDAYAQADVPIVADVPDAAVTEVLEKKVNSDHSCMTVVFSDWSSFVYISSGATPTVVATRGGETVPSPSAGGPSSPC